MNSLDRLLAPRSVAIIAGRYAAPALRQLERIGFAGTVHVVSPSRHEISGVPTIPEVADLPNDFDAALVAVPAAACSKLVRALRAKGCGGVVCFSSEFAEAGAGDLQADLVASAGDLALLGPNCHGFVNGLDRVAMWPDVHGVQPIERGVAILSQSGNIAINLTMQQRSVPIALVASLGNQAQLGAAQLVRHLLEDPRITAIGLQLEGVTDAAALAEAAIAAHAAGKPIIVLKTGCSVGGARATMTHTSTLAGSSKTYDAFFDRAGIGQVDTMAGFLEGLKLLHVHGRLAGRRIGSVSCSGGEAAMMADLAEARGLDMPGLRPQPAARIEAALDGRVRADNPLDYHTFIWGQRERLIPVFLAFLADEFHLAMLILDYPRDNDHDVSTWDITLQSWVSAATMAHQPAAVVSTLPECLPEDRRKLLVQAGIVPLQGAAEAMEALVAASCPPPGTAPMHCPALLAGRIRQYGEAEGKQLVADFGVPVPQGQVVRIDAAAAVAARLGFPVVVKTANPAIGHKADHGGVALSLRSSESVALAAERMRRLGEHVLVERMAEGIVVEVILGVSRDPTFGPVVVVGAGGVLAELIADSVTLLLPLDRPSIETALNKLRLAKLLDGYRGRERGDRAALIDAVLAVARLASAHADRLVELDINPLLVLPDGRGVMAADVLIRMVEP